MAKKTKILLLIIFTIALFLRFYQLGNYPAGFHIDEASLGYNAYSILKTGRDENGQAWPLHIDMFGDQRPAGYQYLTILPVKLLGLNEWSTRSMSALFGALSVGSIFLLAWVVFGSFTVALTSAVILAFSPWHLVISRAGAETIVALFLIILGAAFFIKGILEEQKYSYLGAIAWFFSLFFYHTSRVFVPGLAMAILIILYPTWKNKPKQIKMASGLAFLAVALVSVFLVFGTGVGSGRFQQVSIFHFPEIRLVLEEQFREDGITGVPLLLTRVLHNKVANYGLGYLKEYFRYFSLNYFFVEGGPPAWYRVPGMGLLYLVELPFLLIGLFSLVVNSRFWQGWKKDPGRGRFLLPVVWLVLGPVVAAVTRDDVPNVQRSLVMLPALILIVAFGYCQAYGWVKERLNPGLIKAMAIVLALAFVWNFSYFTHQYFVHAPIHQNWYRFEGFKEMVLAVEEKLPEHDRVMVSKNQGGTYMHYLFFLKYDPKIYQALGSPKDRDFQGFGKMIFMPKDCPTDLPKGDLGEDAKILYVASGNCQEAFFTHPSTQLIKRKDETVVFRIR